MESKLIHVVWCDDAIDSLYDKYTQVLFEEHNCILFKKAHNSDELNKILDDYKEQVDAVITDFNMGASETFPKKDMAKGFQWVHEHCKEYAPIPFYLYTGRDIEFIKEKYDGFEYSTNEDDYFFGPNKNVESKRNRHFQGGELGDLLEMIEEETVTICTPEYRIRQEYSDAFVAINKFGLDASVFLQILLFDEKVRPTELRSQSNQLRMVIDKLVGELKNNKIIPSDLKLNEVPHFLADKSNTKYDSDDYMPKSLSKAFSFFLDYTQDGSHDNTTLSIEFNQYLSSTKDIFLVKALAIICLDIIKWFSIFHDKYLSLKLCDFKPIEVTAERIETIKGQEGAIWHDESGKQYFIVQPKNEVYKYQVGTRIQINSIRRTSKEFGYFYCYGLNLDVE